MNSSLGWEEREREREGQRERERGNRQLDQADFEAVVARRGFLNERVERRRVSIGK